MTSYIIRRVILALIVLIIATLLVFIATHILPGDPIYMVVSASEASTMTIDELAQIRQKYGLDKPLPEQYAVWLGQVIFHGNFGKSIQMDTPVSRLWGERIPVSLHLGLVAFAIGISIGIQPPEASWGSMVNDGYKYLLKVPVLSVAPGAAILLIVFAFNMVGDGLRDALDPRLRGTI
jgi:ABC-type dipeptide/oligopeptide/nickel transport system permease component